MSEIQTWSATAANNNSAAPNGFPEGMLASAVNNSAREVMAALAKWHLDINGTKASGGSSNAYTLAPNRTYSAYAEGTAFLFAANHTNTGAATLNVSSLGAKAIKDAYGQALSAGDITSGQLVYVVYDNANGYFRAINIDTNGTFLQSGTGAASRSWNDKASEVFSITDFGAAVDGSTDDTAAVQAAIDALEAAGGGSLLFPAGTCLMASGVTITGSNIYLKGEGPGASFINFSDADGTLFTVEPADPVNSAINRFGISNLGVYSAVEHTAGDFLSMDAVHQFWITNVSFSDFFGGIHQQGCVNGFYSDVRLITGVSFTTTRTGSYGIKFSKGSNTTVPNPAETFLTNVNIRGQTSNRYFDQGCIINCSDGLWFSNCHFGPYLATNGMQIKSTADTNQLTGLMVSNCWFDGNVLRNIIIERLSTQSAAYGLFYFNNIICYDADNEGITVDQDNLKSCTFSGGTVYGAGNHGILLRRGSDVHISGMHILDNGDDASGSEFGIWVPNAGPMGSFSVIGCRIGNIHGTGSQTYGIGIASGNDYYRVIGNDVRTNATGGLSLGDIPDTTKIVKDNLGHLTDNYGSASISPDANGEATISHGLGSTPRYVNAAIRADTTYSADVVSVSTTTLTVRIKNSSGADVTTGSYQVDWNARA